MNETADERRAREEREAREAATARDRADAQGTEGAADAGAAETAAPAGTAASMDVTGITGVDSLRDMTAEEGIALYNHLPSLTNGDRYTMIADQVTELLTMYQSVSTIPLPEGMSPGQAIQGWLGMLQRGRDTLTGAERLFFDSLEPLLGQSEAARNVRAGYDTVANIGQVLEGAVDGALFVPSQLWNAPHNMGVATGGAIDRNISEEQARAIGAAYAYSVYLASPDAPASQRREQPKTGFDAFLDGVGKTFEWIVGWGQLGLMHLTHSFPIVPAIMKAVGNSINNLLTNGRFEFDLATAQEQVAQEQAEELRPFGGRIPNHAQLIEHNRNSQEVADDIRNDAAATFRAMGTVAGIRTEEFSDILKDGAIVRDNNGDLFAVDPNSGSFAPTPFEVDGQQLNISNEYRGLPKGGRDGFYTIPAYTVAAATSAAALAGGAILLKNHGPNMLREARMARIAATSGFMSGFVQGFGGGFYVPFLNRVAGRMPDRLNNGRLHGKLSQINNLEAVRLSHLSRQQEALNTIARLESVHQTERVAQRIDKLRSAADDSLKAAEKIGHRLHGTGGLTGARNLNPFRLLQINGRQGILNGLFSRVDHMRDLDNLLEGTKYGHSIDPRTGRTVVASRTATQSAEVVETLARARSVSIPAAAETLGRVLEPKLVSAIDNSAALTRSLNALRSELPTLLTRASADNAARVTRIVEEAITLQATAARASEAAAAAIRSTAATSDDIVRLAREAATAQAAAATKMAEIGRIARIEATSATRIAEVAQEAAHAGNAAARLATTADDVARVASPVTDAATHAARALAPDVIQSSPEVLRVLTPETVRLVPETAWRGVTVETIRNIPENAFVRLSETALGNIPPAAWAALPEARILETVTRIDDAEKVARIFTPEVLRHLAPEAIQHLPVNAFQHLNAEQLRAMPREVLEQIKHVHGAALPREVTRHLDDTLRVSGTERARGRAADIEAGGDAKINRINEGSAASRENAQMRRARATGGTSVHDAPAGTGAAADAAEAGADGARAAHATTEAVHVAAEVAEEGARGVRALTFGRVFQLGGRILGKVVRVLPVVGVVGTGLTMFVGSAEASEGTDGDFNHWTRLDHDLQTGVITQAQYNYYRGIQTAYTASGAGGLVTAAVTEAAQVGAEHMDPVLMRRYVPESLTGLITDMATGGSSHAPATPTVAASAQAPIQTPADMQRAILEQEARTVEAQRQAQEALASANNILAQTRVPAANTVQFAGGNASVSLVAAYVNHVPDDAAPGLRPDSVAGGMAPIGVVLGHA